MPGLILQKLLLFSSCRNRGRVGAVGKPADSAAIGITEQIAIGPFKVKQQAGGLAHVEVIKGGLAGIEKESLHRTRHLVRDFLFDDLALFNGSKVVGGGPMLGTVVVMQIIIAGLEGFKTHVSIAEKFENNLIKVVTATVDRQVGGPVVLDPLENHLLTRFD